MAATAGVYPETDGAEIGTVRYATADTVGSGAESDACDSGALTAMTIDGVNPVTVIADAGASSATP